VAEQQQQRAVKRLICYAFVGGAETHVKEHRDVRKGGERWTRGGIGAVLRQRKPKSTYANKT
jgi:hypothetical protein